MPMPRRFAQDPATELRELADRVAELPGALREEEVPAPVVERCEERIRRVEAQLRAVES
jgi:hypothetical protein